MQIIKQRELSANGERRRLTVAVAALTLGQLFGGFFAKATSTNLFPKGGKEPPSKPRTTFSAIKEINAGVLKTGYVDVGPMDGPVVILLHGWPYDIYSFIDVVPRLVGNGFRVILPYLRGYGAPQFLDSKAKRNGEPAAMAVNIIDLMNALMIQKATIAGFDWGARTANIIAALWPERCGAMVSVSGYLIGSQEAGHSPLPPTSELQWWSQFYFAIERGRLGYDKYRNEFASRSGDSHHRSGGSMTRHSIKAPARWTIRIMWRSSSTIIGGVSVWRRERQNMLSSRDNLFPHLRSLCQV